MGLHSPEVIHFSTKIILTTSESMNKPLQRRAVPSSCKRVRRSLRFLAQANGSHVLASGVGKPGCCSMPNIKNYLLPCGRSGVQAPVVLQHHVLPYGMVTDTHTRTSIPLFLSLCHSSTNALSKGAPQGLVLVPCSNRSNRPRRRAKGSGRHGQFQERIPFLPVHPMVSRWRRRWPSREALTHPLVVA